MPRLNVAKMLHITRLTRNRFVHPCGDQALSKIMMFFLALETQKPRLAKLQSKLALRVMLAVLSLVVCLGPGISTAQANKYAAIVIEEASGKVLFSRNAEHLRYPASLTKIMTLYLLFEDIEAGRITLKSQIPVSRTAAGRSPSKLYLRPGQSISAEQAIFALVTKSANDVATALAETLSGSERKFAQRMTRKARALGMKRTVFKNASGLPNRRQISTARDMAKLAVAMRRDFPHFFKYFSTRSFNWQGRKYSNHNKLLSKYSGTDGIKTGYINASGFNLVATVERKGVRLIGVVFGGKTSHSRDRHMMQILDNQFKRVKTIKVRQASLVVPKILPIAPPGRSKKPLGLPPVRKTVNRQNPVEKPDEFIDMSLASLDSPDLVTGTSWSVQIGSFARRVNAHRAAIIARRMADDILNMTPANLMLVTRGEIPLWRVRFNDLDENQARAACAALFSAGRPCIAVEVTATSRG